MTKDDDRIIADKIEARKDDPVIHGTLRDFLRRAGISPRTVLGTDEFDRFAAKLDEPPQDKPRLRELFEKD